MSRIQATFEKLAKEGRKALIPYVAAGDPDVAASIDILRAMADAGADIIELGVPFSDPMADGPVIQRAAERALLQGTGMSEVLSIVAALGRTHPHTPVVLMGYANPIERYGIEKFAVDAQAAGVDGVLVVDYPPEECQEFIRCLKAHAIDPIFLLAPTSTEMRMKQIASMASGYVYYVSLRGVTGASHLDVDAVAQKLTLIRQFISVPLGVGFGISDAETARAVAQVADAVVIGSALVQRLESEPRTHVAQAAGRFVQDIRAALDT